MATGTPPNENLDSSDYVNLIKFAYQSSIQIQRRVMTVKVRTHIFKKITLIDKKEEEEGKRSRKKVE